MVQQSLVGHGLPIMEASRSHSRHTKPCTSLEEWSARSRGFYLTTHNTHKRHPCPWGFRKLNPSKPAATEPSLTPRGHRDRLTNLYISLKSSSTLLTQRQIEGWWRPVVSFVLRSNARDYDAYTGFVRNSKISSYVFFPQQLLPPVIKYLSIPDTFRKCVCLLLLLRCTLTF